MTEQRADPVAAAAMRLEAAVTALAAALARRESRGGHFRRDHPLTDADPRRTFIRWNDLLPASWKLAAE